jgi:hypothetical protein
MDIITDKKSLLDLVGKAKTGELVLPQFQRSFVWSRDDVQDLMLSIIKGYFIGSFLLLRTEHDNLPFAVRPIEGIEKKPEDLKPDLMVLDGQQRLTSLYYVFYAPPINLKWTKHPYRFFIRLGELSKGNFDDIVFSERSDWCDEYLVAEKQFEQQIVPFTEVLTWDDWQMRYELWLVQNRGQQALADYVGTVKPSWVKLMGALRQLLVPTIELPKVPPNDDNRLAEVCAIFEKINSTGVRLSVYDLLAARLYRHKIDLHALWEESLKDHPKLAVFSAEEPDTYGILTLRTISLLRNREVKSKAMINLEPKNFVDDWRIAVAYIEKALDRITSTSEDGFGAFQQKWVPYTTMIPVLAALLHRAQTRDLGHKALKTIKRWYWSSVFLERYAGAVESTTYADYTDVAKYLENHEHQPAVFAEAETAILKNPNYSIRGTTRVNSVYKGVMNLIAIRGAKDFQADDSIEFYMLDDHHIFPKAFLHNQKDAMGNSIYSSGDINTIVNRTLTSSKTNQRISKMSPQTYMHKIVPAESSREIMGSHFIDSTAVAFMEQNNYEDFLKHREGSVIAEIRRRIEPV